MQTLCELLAFAGKALIIFVTFAASIAFFFTRASRTVRRRTDRSHVQLREVSARWKEAKNSLRVALADRAVRKKLSKALEKENDPKTTRPPEKRVFVVDFEGDIAATATEALREEVTAILSVAEEGDEVVMRLESSGGVVHGYGLAASQLARVRDRKLPLTICVDKVAASGGYMMACVADHIVAAPFAIVGSIGVVAQVPNLHRLLGRLGIDYEDVTAGKYKRTVSLLGNITEEGRKKMGEQIQETHDLFKGHVHSMRPKLDIENVATGEHWYGTQAIELGLVDELRTSDDVLIDKAKDARVFEVECQPAFSPRKRLLSMVRAVFAL